MDRSPEALLNLLGRDPALKAVFMEMIAKVAPNRLKYTRSQLQFLLRVTEMTTPIFAGTIQLGNGLCNWPAIMARPW